MTMPNLVEIAVGGLTVTLPLHEARTLQRDLARAIERTEEQRCEWFDRTCKRARQAVAEVRQEMLKLAPGFVAEIERRAAVGEARQAVVTEIANRIGHPPLWVTMALSVHRKEAARRRDAEVARLFFAGKSDAEIGEAVGCSGRTVQRLVKRLKAARFLRLPSTGSNGGCATA